MTRNTTTPNQSSPLTVNLSDDTSMNYKEFVADLQKDLNILREKKFPYSTDNEFLASLFESYIRKTAVSADVHHVDSVTTSPFYSRHPLNVEEVLNALDTHVTSDIRNWEIEQRYAKMGRHVDLTMDQYSKKFEKEDHCECRIDLGVKLNAMAYMERFMASNPEMIQENTIGHLVLTAVLLADKHSSDHSIHLSEYREAAIEVGGHWAPIVEAVTNAIIESESEMLDGILSFNDDLTDEQKDQYAKGQIEMTRAALDVVFTEVLSKINRKPGTLPSFEDLLFHVVSGLLKGALKGKMKESTPEEIQSHASELHRRAERRLAVKEQPVRPSLLALETAFLKGIDYRCHISSVDLQLIINQNFGKPTTAVAALKPDAAHEKRSTLNRKRSLSISQSAVDRAKRSSSRRSI